MHRMTKFTAYGLIVAVLTFITLTGTALAEKKYYQSSWGGVAVEGYDVVAYFTENKPVEGSKEFAHEWEGAKWYFASADNRDKFIKDPKKYAPQYGGYCAWAVSQGYTASTVPEAWKIVDGKLYLNYSKGVQARWEKDIPGFIKTADKNWPDIENKLE